MFKQKDIHNRYKDGKFKCTVKRDGFFILESISGKRIVEFWADSRYNKLIVGTTYIINDVLWDMSFEYENNVCVESYIPGPSRYFLKTAPSIYNKNKD